MVVSTKYFRHFLNGKQFTLQTDHGSFTWLKNFSEPEGQMSLWLEHLQEFNYHLTQARGKMQMQMPSHLSCHQCGLGIHDD